MEPKDWIAMVLLPAIGWGLSSAWEAWRNRHKAKADAIDAVLLKATEAIQNLTLALVEVKSELKAELRVLTERTDSIPRIKDDLNALGGKVREHAALIKAVK